MQSNWCMLCNCMIAAACAACHVASLVPCAQQLQQRMTCWFPHFHRYISEDFGGTALHPIDIMDASSGVLLQQLTDANLTTICPVNKPHPRRDVIVSGSSRYVVRRAQQLYPAKHPTSVAMHSGCVVCDDQKASA